MLLGKKLSAILFPIPAALLSPFPSFSGIYEILELSNFPTGCGILPAKLGRFRLISHRVSCQQRSERIIYLQGLRAVLPRNAHKSFENRNYRLARKECCVVNQESQHVGAGIGKRRFLFR